MMDLVYMVLYTHQKTKKAKTWQDGTLKVLATGTKAVLYDDKGSKLDVLHVHASDVVTGEQLESDRYYIQVEELQKKSCPQAANTRVASASFPQNSLGSTVQQTAGHSRTPQACAAQNTGFRNEGSGLKRKRGGFIPPRVVRPRTAETEISSPGACSVQPAASPVYAPNRGPLSRPFCNTSSGPGDISYERVPSGALFSGGRITSPESVEKPQDSFRSLVSPQHRPQACVVTKSSPWRTIGSALTKTSPVLHEEQTNLMDGRDQSICREVQSAWNLDRSIGMSPSLRPPPPMSDFVVKPQETSRSLSGNCVQSELNQPIRKRSINEIMALLGKKPQGAAVLKTADERSDSENSAILPPFVQVTDQKPLSAESNTREQSCEEDVCSLKKVDFQNTPTSGNLQNMNALQKSSLDARHQDTNLQTSPACSTVGTDGKRTDVFSPHPTTFSQSSENAITPKLSSSLTSLSKHDFEMEDCFDGDSVSSRSTAVGFGVSSGGDHSQALSDVDFSQVDHQTDLKEEENEDFPDSLTDWCGSDVGEKGIAEVIQEQGSNLTSNKANLNLGCNTGSVSKTPNQENRDVLAEGYSQGERCPQFSGGSEQLSGDAQCAETAVGDTEACFELSFSPLSEVGDSDGETWPEHDGGKSCSQETQFSLKTTVSVEQQLTTGTDQHLSPEHVSQMFEDVPDPVDSHPNHDLNHPVDSVEVCQNADTVHVQKTSSVDDPLMRGDMVNASETRKGDCASQFATQGSSWNSESCVKKGSPVSHSDNVKVDQTLQMEQGIFPEASNTYTVCIKSLNAGSYSIPNNTSDPMRTVNDLHLSPDSYVPTESSHQSSEMPAGDNMAVNRLYQGGHEKDDNREDIQSSCDTYAEEEHNPLWSQSQTDTQESKSGITAESLQKQVEAVVSELSMPSSPLSCVSVSTPDQQPMLNVQNSRFDCCVHVQDSSAGLFRSAKPVSGWTNSEMGKAVNTSHLHQKCGCAQNMQCDCDLDHHHYTKDSPLPTSEALPVHRPFQTVREVLGDRRTTAQQAPFCSLRGKGADSVLQGSVIEDKSQADILVESLTSDSADMESPHISQSVSSPLPHPQQLLKGSALDIAIPASSSEVTAPDIAQSISARLTDYKMHGMLASDVVQRPMAYRRRVVDHQHNSLPLVNSPTALVTQGICSSQNKGLLDPLVNSPTALVIQGICSSRNKGLLDPLINSPTALVTQGICNSRNKGLLDLSPREAVDQSVSCTGASGFQVHTSGSAWTPESRLFSPAGDILETSETSLFIDWDGGKPHFVKPKGNAQVNLNDDTQQVPVFADGVTLLQMSSQCLKTSGGTTSTRHSRNSPSQKSSCPVAVPLTRDMSQQQNSPRLFVSTDCRADGEKRDEILKDNGDQEESGGVFVNGNLQTIPDFHMKEKSVAVSRNGPVFGNSTCRIGEDSTVSPVLFSQFVQSQGQAAPVSRTQRSRRLVPVVTAPEELAANESLQSARGNEVEDTMSLKGTGIGHKTAIPSQQERPVNSLDPFSLQTNSSDSLAVCDDRHSPMHFSREVEDQLLHSHVENLDFSGFMDSFPETDQVEDLELDTDSVTTLSKCSKAESDAQDDEAWKQKEEDVKVDCTAHLVFDSGESTSRTDAQKVRQTSSRVGHCSENMVSSPRFLIANTGLDCIEEMEQDSPVADDDKGQSQRSPAEQESFDNIQKQNKITKFAHRFCTLHPYVGKENQARLTKGKTMKAYGTGSGYQKSFEKGASFGHEILAPSDPTDSPPLDITPERGVEKVLHTGRNNGQCQLSHTDRNNEQSQLSHTGRNNGQCQLPHTDRNYEQSQLSHTGRNDGQCQLSHTGRNNEQSQLSHTGRNDGQSQLSHTGRNDGQCQLSHTDRNYEQSQLSHTGRNNGQCQLPHTDRNYEQSQLSHTGRNNRQCQLSQQTPSSAYHSAYKSSQLRNSHSASHMGAETSQPGQTGFEFHQTRLPEETAQTQCSPYIKSKQLRHPTTHFGSETIQPTQTGFRPARLPEETAQAQAPGPAVGTGCVSGPVRKVGLGKFRRPGVSTAGGCLPGSQFQSSLCHELQFCSREEVERQATPVRQVVIPPSFQSLVSYKQILTAALTEFINIQLFTVAKTYHCALSKVDLTAYIEGIGAMGNLAGGSTNPACKCGSASKVALVKKEGPNKGRFFYACSAPRDKQCKFFQWVDQQSGSSSSKGSGTSMVRPKFSDPASITGYFRGQGLAVYCQCQFVRRADNHNFKFGFPKWVRPLQSDGVQKKSIFIKLPKKDSTATHARDDLWVVSKSLSFAKGETFVARSTFHGPNTHGEVAVDPVAGYSASLWTDGSVCHTVHCGNAGTELTCLTNIQDHVDMTSLPLLPHLLSPQPCSVTTSRMASKGFKAPTAMQSPGKLHIPPQFVHDLAADFVGKYQLNSDQAEAVRRVATMMDKEADPASSLLLIHGVFGAGKSFLLSVVILFLVEVFQRNDAYCPGVPFPWKLLLSSTTNVAVDRVLQGLLELGFDDFVRVGSVKKIAKPVLPYSMHASGSDNHELRDLQEMLKSTDITSAEKHCIRKSIERHRLGENRKRLGAVRVVGVTCAACSFQCLDKMQFPFVVLDECSQMTEPSSLLPIARSACEKLMLVGDPKQLDPTLQGSEAAHREGLEQTLFDRLMKMGQDPVMLRTQYRCHPAISAVANTLFYHGHLRDGVAPHHRQPILDLFPTMCFYDVSGGEETTDSSGSFTNEAEAQFVALLLSVLMVRGLQPTSVGVITLYRAQARHILNIIRQSKGDAQRAMAGVQVSTVDAFQGAERDIIILSCVRTRSVGFIDSDKRMNVALTRARHHMLIVGHQKNLHANRRWAEVISHCQAFAGGVVAASAASRQLQAVLDQTSEDQDYTTADSSAEGPHQAQHAGARKRKSPPQKGVADGQTGQVSLPAATKTVISSNPLEPMDAAHSSSDQMESSLTGRVVMNEEPAMPENTSPEGSSRGADCSPVENRRSRVKPLVIDEEEEDQSDSDDDFLPGGLF